ncbi:MAG TPA: PEP-CTERM sorting domain-containing protein, partial [Phycisphaerae bacterium]|nr:PEP-CTERM sorting domain-containing protein [Phycisphaerae bacterium]
QIPITPTGPGYVNAGWALDGETYWDSNNDVLLEQDTPGNNYNPDLAYQIVQPVGGFNVGDEYEFSGWFLTDTGITLSDGGVGVEFGFRGAWNGTDYPTVGIDATERYWIGASGLNTWTGFSLSEIAPVGAQYLIVYLQFLDDAQTSTEDVYFGNVSVGVPGPPPPPLPEPSTLALVGMGLSAIPFYFIRRRKN